MCKEDHDNYLFLIGNDNRIGSDKTKCVAKWNGKFTEFYGIPFVTERDLTFLSYDSIKNTIYKVGNNNTYKAGLYPQDSNKYIWLTTNVDDEATVISDTDSWGNPIVNTKAIDLFTNVTSKSGAISNVERGSQIRYGNASEVRCEIRYGTDDSVFKLEAVYIDYLKAPQNIHLTQKQIDKTIDTSQMLEYPDYVCQEIINELVHIIMENIGDGRLNTHPVVS